MQLYAKFVVADAINCGLYALRWVYIGIEIIVGKQNQKFMRANEGF